ncbi:C40 family peptidase [Trinickia dinghuensis]|uniref:Peptidoglycan endopeptidase n=1 Tax=Trinickia dinghuensis TaxID=2291023 RepID=A0A3D8JQD3_9BURK|nr:C40 family peptidase [Trinickia dinghuensis]RDU95333.1 peptidoglycan endopeptidase [Trinickia dinghuensis]
MRLWLVILVVLSLAACSSAPPRSARSSGGSYGENTLRTMPPGLPRFVDHSIGREEISIEAMSLIGIPYRWGGNTPESGFDCSGLVRYVVARAADVDLPRTTADISHRGESIEPDEIAPGDLIFFNTTGRPHSHVGIYVGKLRFVNAPSTGGTVRLDYLTNPYWARHFDGIRRVAAPLKAPSPFDAPTEVAGTRAPEVPETPAEPPVRTDAAAVATAPAPAAASPAPVVSAMPAASPAPQVPTSAAARSEDPIDAAADAFEPPPPAAGQAAQQARQAGASTVQPASTESNVPVTRASTASSPQSAPASTTDDPIARFANNGG